MPLHCRWTVTYLLSLVPNIYIDQAKVQTIGHADFVFMVNACLHLKSSRQAKMVSPQIKKTVYIKSDGTITLAVSLFLIRVVMVSKMPRLRLTFVILKRSVWINQYQKKAVSNSMFKHCRLSMESPCPTVKLRQMRQLCLTVPRQHQLVCRVA